MTSLHLCPPLARRSSTSSGWSRCPSREGCLCRRGAPVEGGDVLGTATLAAFTDDPQSSSAIHRLPVDDPWHLYLGDPVDLALLHPGGGVTTPRLGQTSSLASGCSSSCLVKAAVVPRSSEKAFRDDLIRLHAIAGRHDPWGRAGGCHAAGTCDRCVPHPTAAQRCETLSTRCL